MSLTKKIEAITVTAVACIAVIISVLDLTGALDEIKWLNSRIPIFTLLAVGALASYLITEQISASRDQSTRLQDALNQVVAATSGIEVRVFTGRAEYWQYAAERIRTCKTTIDDLTWGLSPKSNLTAQDVAAYKEYRRQIGLATSGKGDNRNKTFREVISFPNETRIPLARALMNDRHPNYHLRLYDYDHSGSPLLLQFFVFDQTEVLIASPSPRGGALDSRYMGFKSKQLAQIMSHYYEMIWRDALVLKDNQVIKDGLISKIAQRLGISNIDDLKSDRL